MSEQGLSLVAYCGLDCAECFSYKMTVSEAAKNLRRELRAAKVKDVWKDVPFLGEYESFKKSLDGLAMMRCTRACRGGGGNPWCKIRKCCQRKGLEGCWECGEFESCTKLVERYRQAIKKIKKSKLAASATKSQGK